MAFILSTIGSRTFGGQLQPRRRALARLAGLFALGASAFMAAGVGPAAAAPGDAWEQGCAYRAPSGIPGQGQSGLNDYCARLRFCQNMSNQGRDMAPMGCFGFEPSLSSAQGGKRS
jgi:hypothetical protein